MAEPVTRLESIRLCRFLSFGDPGSHLDLRGLNVLIGPNASGKSNFIEALGLLRSTPGDLAVPIREGGGIQDWLWKGSGSSNTESKRDSVIEAVVELRGLRMPIRYKLSIAAVGQGLQVITERIENKEPQQGYDRPYFFYSYEGGRALVNTPVGPDQGSEHSQSGIEVGRHQNRPIRTLPTQGT